jgi:hypothetical protein
MTLAVTDIDRPDVNGVQPKMYAIESLAFEELYTDVFGDRLIPYMNIDCNDNLMSNIDIIGSFDDRRDWLNGIRENSHYFRFSIKPAQGRYYEAGQPVTAELYLKSYEIASRFRKYTGTPEKAIAKIKQWILDNR